VEVGVLQGRRQDGFRLETGLAWAMHEIRGPLLGVRAVLELLLRRERDPRAAEMVRHSLAEVDRLARTAEDLLSWATGGRELRLRRADLVRVVEEAVGSCRLETGEDRIVLCAPSRAYARIAAGPLHVAVANLVRNALAFSDPGTKVEVVVEDAGEHVRISVTNEGAAIPREERSTIFEPFVRGPRSGGSGLGLFIARRVVEAHDGRIWVDREAERTAFRILLPSGRGERRSAP
jgi:signal transduction histidine kinase